MHRYKPIDIENACGGQNRINIKETQRKQEYRLQLYQEKYMFPKNKEQRLKRQPKK